MSVNQADADLVFSIFKGFGFRATFKKRQLETILRYTHSKFLSDGVEPFKVSLPLNEFAIAEDLKYYTENGYQSMDSDVFRNKWFQDALIYFSSQHCHNWLEIGPGASGTLSRMVLDASAENCLTAIEANSDSAECVRDILSVYGDRVSVLNAFAETATIPSDNCYNGLVAEVLGHFASSEGYIFILNSCKARLKDTVAFIPEAFGTLFVPVDLSRLGSGSECYDLAKVGPRILQFNRFPFSLTQLSNSHGIMESYETREVIANRKLGPYKFLSEVRIDRSGSFDGIAFYIFLENKNIGRTTSNRDLPNMCTNWLNIFLPVDSTVVSEGERISCETTVHTQLYGVKYDFSITVSNKCGKCRYKTQRHVNYADILGNEGTLVDCIHHLSQEQKPNLTPRVTSNDDL